MAQFKLEEIYTPGHIAPRPGQIIGYIPGNAWRPEVKNSPDLQRVMHLPRRPQPEGDRAEALIQYMTETLSRENSDCRCRTIRPNTPCITELKIGQAWALFEMSVRGGIIGGIGVGQGKTLLSILCPLVVKDCKTALLLVKPDLVEQLALQYKLAAQHFRVPSLVLHTKGRAQVVVPGAPVLHVLPYSRLCRATHTDFIAKINPDLIVSDEIHKLRNLDTATGARVERHLKARPDCHFAGWTGTLTDKSLTDYGHLCTFALREQSPLPNDPNTLAEWALAIDPIEDPAPPGKLLDLCEPGESVYRGFHRRLTETMGMVITCKGAISTPLTISKRNAPEIPPDVMDAIMGARNFVRPDGEELVDATEAAKCAREAACGFFYKWEFRHGETADQIDEWLAARKLWNQELRAKLKERREFLDSPQLCEEAATRHLDGHDPGCCYTCNGHGCTECSGTGKVRPLPIWPTMHYDRWRQVKDTVRPYTVPVRMNPYLAEDAAEWGHKHRGVIWYSFNAFGEWVAEMAGLPLHGGGPHCAERIATEDGSRSIVASIQAHGTGRDGLQYLFCDQLITVPPSSATTWEQLLGRLHRMGQSKTVTGELYAHTEEFLASLEKAAKRSWYVQETLGSDQKIQATGLL